jgi:hypothetical protein
MPERPDLRHIAASLREALDGLDREALVDVLTYVLNEYVVEGPPPLAAHQVERLEDLSGLSMAALVSALQTRLDIAGLELLRVEGEEVRAHTAGGWVPLQPLRDPARAERPAAIAPDPGRAGAGASRGAEPASRTAASAAPPAPTGRAAADEALSRGRGDLLGGERGVVTPPAPRPRGLSISGRPSATAPQPPAQPAPSASQPPASQPANPPNPASPPAPNDEQAGERKQDDASIRFSLLELD